MNEEIKDASVDSLELEVLLRRVREAKSWDFDDRKAALIAHINAWADERCNTAINQLAASRAMLPVTDSQREAVREAVTAALGEAYDCLRVWSAWSYGTMGPDDFRMVAEDDDRVNEITEAVISALTTPVAGWVSVEERLPEFGQRVLAYCPKYGQRETCFDRYNEGSISRRVHGDDAGYFSWSEPTHNWASSWNPTHWQPIPAPPAPAATPTHQENK